MADEEKFSTTAAALELRPLTTGELIDRGFQLYRRHFIELFYFSAMIQAFPFALGLVLMHFVRQSKPEEMVKDPSAMAVMGAIFLVSAVLLAIGEGALTLHIARLYLGGTVSIRSTLQSLPRQVWVILYSTLLKYLIIGLAFLLVFVPAFITPFLHGMLNLWILAGLFLLGVLLFVPGLVLAVRYLLMIAVIVLEKKGGWKALRRSSEITRYDPGLGFMYWGETRLSILLLVVVAANLLVVIVSRVPLIVAGVEEILRGTINPSEMSISPIITTVSYLLNFLGSSLIAPLYVVAGTLFYYDVRVRKEALDLELIAGTLNAGDTPAAPSPSKP